MRTVQRHVHSTRSIAAVTLRSQPIDTITSRVRRSTTQSIEDSIMRRFSSSTLALSLAVTTISATALTACNDKSSTTSATTDVAARAVAIAGYQQSITVGTVGSDSLRLVVYGASGDLLPGATVTWTVTDGTGTLSSASSVTNAQGVASVAYTAGTTSGITHIAAAVGNVAPVQFEEDLMPGAAASLVAMTPVTDTLTVGEPLTGALFRVVDQYGNAVPNVTVTVTEQSAADGDALQSTALVSDQTGVVSDTFVPGAAAGNRVLVFTTDTGLTLTYTVDVQSDQSAASRN